jgi:predicted molibdopterin-dependent oxidoreductase YjgC
VDHRVRVVPEADRVFSALALEVNPGDLAAFGLAAGGAARITSGAGELIVPVRADWRTPPGQLYLPFNPADESLVAFIRAAERPAQWPLSCISLTGIAPAGPGK